MARLTLGSLFDGSGGFPLGGLLAGITPVWASEIEPFPIRVTTRRLPKMKHLGDVSKINGAEIEPVDIITFGSPCTDMSIAGKRAGLGGEKSSLFYHAIRIIKEMRDATNGTYPRWACWENVFGAFSSNAGSDFKSVLDAFISIADPSAQVPAPEKNHWPYADVYLGDGWSAAYRTFDARYWGVPQRRRRVYLVADFAGQRAGQVLFESEGLSGYSASRFRAWQEAARCTPAGVGGTSPICLNDQGGSRMNVSSGVAGTLRAQMDGHPPCILESHPIDGRIGIDESGSVQTLTARMGTGGMNVPLLLKVRSGCEGGGKGPLIQKDVSATLSCNNDQTLFLPRVYAVTTGSFLQVNAEQSPTLAARDYKSPTAVSKGYMVRRLTPTECARLQGFPDWWCAGLDTPDPTEADIAFWTEIWETHRKAVGTARRPKSRNQIVKWLKHPHSDAAEYRMWGNGVALPCVFFVLAGIAWAAGLPDSNPDFQHP